MARLTALFDASLGEVTTLDAAFAAAQATGPSPPNNHMALCGERCKHA